MLNKEQIYRPNMNTIEGHFHGETGVDILLEEAAYSVRTRPVPGRRKSLKRTQNQVTVTALNLLVATAQHISLGNRTVVKHWLSNFDYFMLTDCTSLKN